MSFLSAICSSVLGLGILMSAYRYNDLDASGIPRWFSLAVCTGALAITVSTGVAYLCRDGQAWEPTKMIGLLPMMIVSWMLAVLAGRHARRSDAYDQVDSYYGTTPRRPGTKAE
jgi:peptidoglycan/LPS O-acetylase OafA/YrhL